MRFWVIYTFTLIFHILSLLAVLNIMVFLDMIHNYCRLGSVCLVTYQYY